MRRELGDGIELDDDVSRVDVDAVHAYLTTAYWALGRTREKVVDLVGGAARVVGLYDGARQIAQRRVGLAGGAAVPGDLALPARVPG